MSFPEQYEIYRSQFEEELQAECAGLNFHPQVLGESMRYSLLVGGKRIRPVLFYAALASFGADWKAERELALALECIHTYSLIHDDLPAMDNDDFRRGKPSNHKKFGEANAILAGDALLSHACELMLAAAEKGKLHLRAARRLAAAAGERGMVAGQSEDLLLTGKRAGEKELFSIYRRKTGELIAAPLVMAAILSGKDEARAERLGYDLGALFQLTDDILDETGGAELGKTRGKDREEGKLTCLSVFGMEKSLRLADETARRCEKTLSEWEGENSFLTELVRNIRSRNK